MSIADFNVPARQVVDIAIRAGQEILKFYKSDYDVRRKSNNSPVTEADVAANDLIQSALIELTPDIPIISEETVLPDLAVRSQWSQFWLLDPLDGTRSFIRGDDEFTVNVALISDGYPVFGVVHSPIEQSAYWASVGHGAFRMAGTENEPRAIRVNRSNHHPVQIIAPKTRTLSAVQEFRNNLESNSMACEIRYASSSIKFCRVAEGVADVFPNFGPTSEWDTAAAQCIVECAGGSVTDLMGNRVRYNKSDRTMRNPPFLVTGMDPLDWQQFLPKNEQLNHHLT